MKASVKLFGSNVLLGVRQKDMGIKLHLPETTKEEGTYNEYFVAEMGAGVTLPIKQGDVVIPNAVGGHQLVRCDVGDGEKNYFLVHESQVGGIQL